MWKIDNDCLFGSLFLGGAEPVFLNLAVEGPLADTQHLGGLLPVPGHELQIGPDQLALDLGQGPVEELRLVGVRHVPPTGLVEEQVFAANRRARGEDRRALDHVLQLTHVPRPGVGAQVVDRVLGEARQPPPKLGRKAAEEVPREGRDVGGASIFAMETLRAVSRADVVAS